VTRSWIRRAVILGVIGAVLSPVVITVALADYDTILVGVTQTREPSRGKFLVIKRFNSIKIGPPPKVPETPEPPKQTADSFSVGVGKLTVVGNGIDGSLGGGVGLIGSASPQMRLEKSLKDLARDLR